MVAVKVENFGGMLPANDNRLLPPNFASYAKDTWLFKGTLVGWKTPQLIHQSTAGTKKVFRIPNDTAAGSPPDFDDSVWMEFADINTDVVRAPAINDQYNRYYWASPSSLPRYNTFERIADGSPSYKLGIPTPTEAPNVVPSVMTPSSDEVEPEVRSYVYTYVSMYGEEGAPSPAFTATGDPTSPWTVTVFIPTTDDETERALLTTRLYRTVTGADGVADFYFVTEFPKGQTSYIDTAEAIDITSQGLLASEGWTPPPENLQGLIAMPNGILAGWAGNDLWFCEPYRPHAWPVAYTISVDYPIVGLGLFGQTLLVTTAGFPSTVTGIHPANMSLSKVQAHEPCISRGSIVSTLDGVYYASQNGIVQANPGAVGVASEKVIRRTDWAAFTDTYKLRAARYHQSYLAYPSSTANPTGLIFSLAEDRLFLAESTQNVEVANIQEDLWTGELFLLATDGKVYHIDPPDDVPTQPYVWRSKEFHFPEPVNLGAMKVYFSLPTGAPRLEPPVVNPTVLSDTMYGFVTVYVDGRRVFSRELRTSGAQWRLPSGFKGEVWQFEFTARVVIHSFQVASSARELIRT